jgi:hypothetical protein
LAVCCFASSGNTGGFSPGRTFGPVVSGPVRLGVAGVEDGATDDGRVLGVGAGVGSGSAPPPLQAASNPAISPIASNRIPTPA